MKMSEHTKFVDLPLGEFLDSLASGDPTPGGGSASAAAGAAGAALVKMVANLTAGRKRYKEVSEQAGKIKEESSLLMAELKDLMDEDSRAFDGVMEAIRMPKETDKDKKARKRALQAATRQATEVPLQIMRRSHRVLQLAEQISEIGNPNALSDALVAGGLARTALRGGACNVRINLSSLEDEGFTKRVRAEMNELLDASSDLYEGIIRREADL